jgi:hypothetical protein
MDREDLIMPDVDFFFIFFLIATVFCQRHLGIIKIERKPIVRPLSACLVSFRFKGFAIRIL